MNVFEFLFVTLPYVFGFLYFIFQQLDRKSPRKWISRSMILFIELQCQ